MKSGLLSLIDVSQERQNEASERKHDYNRLESFHGILLLSGGNAAPKVELYTRYILI
jgi:hypothetical protein